MAERIEVELVDDIDGSTAQQTVTFALDGVTYEIDLSQRHAEQLRSVLAGYIDQARTPKNTSRTTKQQEREDRRVRQENRQLTEQIRGAAQRSRDQRKAQEGSEREPAGESATERSAEVAESRGRDSESGGQVAESHGRESNAQNLEGAPESVRKRTSADVPSVSLPQFSSAAD